MQAESEECDRPMDRLPDELLLLIFSLLSADLDTLYVVGQVCRRWRALSLELWLDKDAVYELSSSPDSTFCRTLALAPQLRSVVFKISNMTDEVVDRILKGCEHVKRVAFKVPLQVRASSLEAILRHYSAHVEEVELFAAAPDVLYPNISSLRKLRKLRLNGWSHSQDLAADMGLSLQGCPELEHLDVERLVWHPGTVQFVVDVAKAMGHQLKHLMLPGRDNVMTDHVITQVLAACPGLESLGGDWFVLPGVAGLPALTSLRLWYSYQDPEPDLFNALLRPDVRAVLARLRHLDLVLGDSTELAGKVLTACSSLKSLSLTTDRPAVQLRQLQPPSCLTHLQLRWRPIRAGLHALQDPMVADGLSRFCSGLPLLTVMTVNGSTLHV